MHMDDGLDTGDIIDIAEIDILPNETTGALFERIAELGARTISPVLDKWVKGEITATPQDDALASHTSKITKEMGLIDWHQPCLLYTSRNNLVHLNSLLAQFDFLHHE